VVLTEKWRMHSIVHCTMVHSSPWNAKMSQSQSEGAFVSVRLVVMDHYMAEPISGLDPVVSEFRGYNIRKVPVLRIFGATTAGQKACLHLHGIFPYLYVPMPDGEHDGFVYRLAASLDKAINISMQQGSSNVQHVYKAMKVSGIPMYGYHPRQHSFIKIFFYNPYMVKRAADLLAGGAVMNKILQPHESHINYELQFMMDYNLQGMNQVHLKHCMFRQGKLHDEYDDIEPFFSAPQRPLKTAPRIYNNDESIFENQYSELMKEPPENRYYTVDDFDEAFKLPLDVCRQSTSELELDAVAADILNHQDLTGTSMNPGLVSLWEDERERRRKLGILDPLTPPGSPPRPRKAFESSDSEKFWYERFLNLIKEKKLAEGSKGSQDTSDPDATINLAKRLRPHVYAVETPERELGTLPSATQLEPHVPTLSESRLDLSSICATPRPGSRLSIQSENVGDSLADQTIVDEELITSQAKSSISLTEEDDDLIDLLAGLAQEAGSDNDDKQSELSDHISLVSASQNVKESQGSTKKLSQAVLQELEKNDESETLEMSQAVWDTDDNWDDLDKTVMEHFAKNLEEENDMEDMFQ